MEFVSEYPQLFDQGNPETSGPANYIIVEFVEDALVAVRAFRFTLNGYSLCTSPDPDSMRRKIADVLVEIH